MEIPVSRPDIGSLEISFVNEALASSWVSGRGPFIERFEGALAARCGVNHVAATSSGTTALHLALLALGIGPGDEVVVPALSYVAAANAVRYVGAQPVLADVNAATWSICPTSVERVMTRKVKCVVAVHNFGQVADMKAIRSIADSWGVPIIEDAAEALAADDEGVVAGSVGDVATFSFYGNKIITGGEGGAVVSRNPDLIDRIRFLANQAMDPTRRYFFPEVGYNYRMTNLAAAILCAQLKQLDALLLARNEVWHRYRSGLAGVAGLELPPHRAGVRVSPWLFGCLLTASWDGALRDRAAQHLENRGIETRPFFAPLHTLPAFATCRRDDSLLVSEGLASRGICLPTFAALGVGDQQSVIDNLVDFIVHEKSAP